MKVCQHADADTLTVIAHGKGAKPASWHYPIPVSYNDKMSLFVIAFTSNVKQFKKIMSCY